MSAVPVHAALSYQPKNVYPSLYAPGNVQVEAVKVQKILRNGQILIVRDGKVYNMMGQIVEN